MKKHSNIVFGVFLVIIIFSSYDTPLHAQIRDVDSFGNPLPIDNNDTVYNEADTLISKAGFFSIFKGKPGKAALYGLLFPSGGQIYNKKWWKVPIALGIDGGFTYVLINNRQVYREIRDEYLALISMPNFPTAQADRLREQRNQFRKWSEYAWIWLVAAHIFTVADAYVDRHMMDFDISPDLSVVYNPYTGAEWAAQLKLTIPISHFYTYSKRTRPLNELLILP